MITAAEFANYFNGRGTDCLVDTRLINGYYSTIMFYGEDIMTKADFVQDEEIFFDAFTLKSCSGLDQKEIARRLNVLNAVMPGANLVFANGKLSQLQSVDTTVTGLEEMYSMAAYNAELVRNAYRLIFCDAEAMEQMMRTATPAEDEDE